MMQENASLYPVWATKWVTKEKAKAVVRAAHAGGPCLRFLFWQSEHSEKNQNYFLKVLDILIVLCSTIFLW